MSKADKSTEVSCNDYNLISEGDDMWLDLMMLTDLIAASVAANIKDKADCAQIMDICIKRLEKYKKQFEQ